VIAAFEFSKETNIPLVVKNTGVRRAVICYMLRTWEG
jgi:hypothetical protein